MLWECDLCTSGWRRYETRIRKDVGCVNLAFCLKLYTFRVRKVVVGSHWQMSEIVARSGWSTSALDQQFVKADCREAMQWRESIEARWKQLGRFALGQQPGSSIRSPVKQWLISVPGVVISFALGIAFAEICFKQIWCDIGLV